MTPSTVPRPPCTRCHARPVAAAGVAYCLACWRIELPALLDDAHRSAKGRVDAGQGLPEPCDLVPVDVWIARGGQ